MAERKEHWRGKGNYLKYGFDTVANRCNLARSSLADQKSPQPSQPHTGLGIAGWCPADSWARSAPRQGAEAALGQQRARGPAGGVPRHGASLPSAVAAAPKAERHLPASLPWPTSPSCIAPALLGQQQTSGDKAAGKHNTSQEGGQLHPRGISEQGFKIPDSPLFWLCFKPTGDSSSLLEGSTLEYLLSLLI